MTWEGSTHVDADRVRAAIGDPDAMAAWGGRERAGDPLRWDVEPTEHGTVFRLTHEAIGSDAELAATWHALLIQLDMQLASGALVPVHPKTWVDDYRDIL